MARVDDKHLALARVYSRSMLELAQSRGAAGELLEELREVVALAERDPAFMSFLESPLVDVEQRRASIEKIFRGRASDLLVDSLQVLNRKGRLALLPMIVASYREELQELEGRVDVHVTTAVELSAALRDRLATAAASYTGLEPQLVEKVDPGLIGGMVLRVGDRKVDASVARRIEKLRQILHERAALEIHRRREQNAAG